MSNAEIRSIFTDENSIFIDEKTPLYTYCGSGDRACLHAGTGHLLFSLPQEFCSLLKVIFFAIIFGCIPLLFFLL